MIDAHVHLWQLGANDCIWPTAADGMLYRDARLDELIATMDDAGVDRAVLVQSQESPRDTAWLLDVAAATDRIAGVIGWADLRDRDAVLGCAHNARIKGLRPMVQGRAADWFDAPAIGAGVAAMIEHRLVLDALIRPIHLPALSRLADRHPDLVIVIDHAAKPEAGPDGFDRWQAAIAPLARHTNVHVKLSGLLTELSPDVVAPTVQALLALFGAGRLLWGSDWPVLTAVAGYREWRDLAEALIPHADRAAVFGGNAQRLYGLAETAHD